MTVDNHLLAVEDLLQSVSRSSVPLLSDTSAHILTAGGKRLRPRLVLLSHLAAGGNDPAAAVPLAAAVEVIHTATLVHDDINDRGTLRRGRETVNSRWGGTFALLTGDFMFTKAYEIMAPFPSEYNRILAGAAIQLVEGETLQIHAARQGALDRDLYLEIIAKKTAALFEAAVNLGALSANAPQEYRAALSQYAFNLGLAFQITDDVLDLVADADQIGKNAGIDIGQGRGIGVVLRAGENSSTVAAKVATAATVASDTAPGPFKESLIHGESLEYAITKGRDKAQEFAALAIASLKPLPASQAVDELDALAEGIVQRSQ
jgi:geranylgeranyl pyrophosphate synthase